MSGVHKPIQIKDLSLSFSHKICFQDVHLSIVHASRIAIVGANGSGKTTFLKILKGQVPPTSGSLRVPADVIFGFVPQIHAERELLSGAQRFQEALSCVLREEPNVLLLDEPTNHLDAHHRKNLWRFLKSYPHTLIIVSHDTQLLRDWVDTIWHIDQGAIHVFSGNWDDYQRARAQRIASLKHSLCDLEQQKKGMHQALMKEQKRAAKSKVKGEKSKEQNKWSKLVAGTKSSQGQETTGKKKGMIDNKKDNLTQQLKELRLPPLILPKFSLPIIPMGEKTILSISEGAVGWEEGRPLLSHLNFSLSSQERVAIIGDNASGKSTFLKAILGDKRVIKSGDWVMPSSSDIGYLDQHYATLVCEKTVYETIAEGVPHWSMVDVRKHLNDFLFRKNEEVHTLVSTLSGGEKVRLSLAQIASKTPKLLILDEITNNLDGETKEHILSLLKVYPMALIVVSHEEDFLREARIYDNYQIQNGSIVRNENFTFRFS